MTTNTAAGRRSQGQVRSARRNFTPLIVDVAVPIGSYYLFKNALGLSTIAALGWSTLVPAARTGWGAVKERTVNGLAALILTVNVAGLLLGLVAGDPRLMLAKESAVGRVVGIALLVSVGLGKPLMTAALKPWIVKGDAAKEAAWTRLLTGSRPFQRAERVFSLVWGAALLGECVVKVVGAYTLPLDTMMWLASVIMIASMVPAFLVGGALAAGPMAGMLAEEARTTAGVPDTEPAATPVRATAVAR